MKSLVYINDRKLPETIGNKARNLKRLIDLGVCVPKTYVVPWEYYQDYLADDIGLVEELQLELSRLHDPETCYAVRSSANIEDSMERSFAGQFKSVLNVQGVENIIQAIWSIWGTARSHNVQAYLEKHDLTAADLCMAVILQEMVDPLYAGVTLSRNPVTGADEVVVEAVRGSGESLVQTGITPERWINKWGTYISEPESTEISMELIDRLVHETREIADKLQSQVDLEWVYDGKNLYWVQARNITALQRHNVYSNHISKEMLPGIIKPLIGSVNIPLVCSMWVRLVTEMVGRTNVKPEELAKPFYYRVYFNMGTLGKIFQEVGMPADSVETLMGLVPPGTKKPAMRPTLKTILRLPNLMVFFLDKWFFAPKMRRALRNLQHQFEAIEYNRIQELSPEELLGEIDTLHKIVQEAAYYNIVGPLLMMMYNRVLDKQLTKRGIEFSKLDFTADLPEIIEYDPNFHLHALHEQYLQLDPAVQEKIRKCTYKEFLSLPGIAELQNGVNNFLEKFGQFSDSGNDFSMTPWRDSPDLVLNLITNFTPTTEEVQEKVCYSDLKLSGLQRMQVGFFYHRAQDFRLLREQISASYTHGYGLFRYYYLALGEHLVQRDLLDDPQDIFYLYDEEVRKLVTSEQADLQAREIVKRHKQDIERFRNIALPSVIYGDEMPPIEDSAQEKMIGVPTSIGHYTGPVRVVRGIGDFNKVQQGDVLVVPFSDVGWTPLFARAGAVIAESGGMLSHSSIVAREYNIPAVVSVAGATQLEDQTMVTVNAHNGEILIHADEN